MRELLERLILAQFSYCLRAIVSIIAGQSPKRQVTTCTRDMLRVSFHVHAILSDPREKCSVNVETTFFLCWWNTSKIFPQRDCFVSLHSRKCIYMHAANEISRFISRMRLFCAIIEKKISLDLIYLFFFVLLIFVSLKKHNFIRNIILLNKNLIILH